MRIVQLKHHLFVRGLGVLHIDFGPAVLDGQIAAGCVREGQDDEKVVVAHQRAFQLLTVLHGHGCLAAATASTASAATATTTTTRTGNPGILKSDWIHVLGADT